jgi:SpoVK/Ycf46/Vps4 family AAA+-type ATPase
VILPAPLKEQVQNDFDQFFRSRDLYENYAIPWKRGALFIGPPGNGKTHTVKALINHLARPCLYVKGFKSEYANEHENIGAVFARARMSTPCLLVLEDLDSMIDNENRSFFLNELDGFESNTGLVVLATTNHPDRLDPAILNRPSRFDRKYYFNLPTATERRAYVAVWNNNGTKAFAASDNARLSNPLPHSALRLSELAIEKVVEHTEDFSFAYMKELFLSATMQWMAARTLTPDSPDHCSIDTILLEQVALLRTQIRPPSTDSEQPLPFGKAKQLARHLRGIFS